jgi:hypothetical protein
MNGPARRRRSTTRLSPSRPPTRSAVTREDESTEPRQAGLLEQVATIGGPIGIIGAALIYLGWLTSRARASTIGVDVEVLGLQDRDYMLSAAGWLLLPALLMSVSVLIAIKIGQYVVDLRQTWIRCIAALLRAVAVLIIILGTLTSLRLLWPFGGGLNSVLAPAALLTAASLWLCANRIQGHLDQTRRTSLTSLAMTTLSMALLLFWTGTEYALYVGREAGERLVAAASIALKDVIIVAPRPLHLHGPGVQVERLIIGDSQEEPSYRYSDLKLLSYQPGERLIVVPASWRQASGRIIILPDDGSFRFEYATK